MTARRDREGLDRLAKELAGGDISRRQAIGRLLSGFGAVVLVGPLSAFAGNRSKCPEKRRCGRTCCGREERCRKHNGHHRCVCKPGRHRCKGTCVNTNTDVHNCGKCGKSCAAGEICSKGKCTLDCAAGDTACDGICTNLHIDFENCGSCGNVCDVGSACTNGLCCPEGQANCSGVCANTQIDEDNCGTCGHPCAAGEYCSGGVCFPTCAADETACGLECCTAVEICDQGTCVTPP